MDALGQKLTVDFIPAATVEPVVSVRESDTLERAVELMRLNNFSQLPVMRGSGSRPVGIVSWRSIGRTLFENPSASLENCIERDVAKVALTDDLIETIKRINQDDYVLVIKRNQDISGIVTSADLGDVLADIARPYLQISQCEAALRELIRTSLRLSIVSRSDVSGAMRSKDRTFDDNVDDLPFGDLVNVAALQQIWEASSYRADRNVLLEELGLVARLRNEIMHFREQSEDSISVQARLHRIVAGVLGLAAGLTLNARATGGERA